ERAVAERENAAITPDQIDGECQDRVADIFAEQRHQIGRHLQHGADRQQQIRQRDQRAKRGDDDHEQRRAAIQRAREHVRHHASTARPLSANSPRGRFCMNTMIRTRMAILPSTAPATGSRNLLAMPSVKAPTSVPHRLPTPPNTTTMKESMMEFCPRLGLTLSICHSATPAMPAIAEPRPKVRASTREVAIPIEAAMRRFCVTARI